VKNFVATGLATAGRLYAGDLNAIQDAVAAQSDYAQRVDAGTFGVGEAALTLLRYGAGEARLTGAFRVDSIVRALGGVYAGQFTTAQRDAIPLGSRPYGLMIFNTTISRLEINQGSDTTPNWQPMGSLTISQNGTQVGVRQGINFIDGSGVTLTLVDQPASNRVDVTIAAPSAPAAGVIPIGGIIMMGQNADTANFLICNGRSLSTTTYATLFAVIGYSYGGSGATFLLPDLRGRAPVGVGTKVALGSTEGLTEPQRSPSHHHLYTSPGDPHGGYTVAGANSGLVFTDVTSGDSINLDKPAYLGVPFGIRYT
jgi:microcystin-dependent protein